MGQIELTWIEKQRYLGVDSGGQSVVLAARSDAGIKPPEALLMSLGSCAAYDVVEILQKQRVQIQQLHVSVSSEQDDTPPWAFKRIHLQFRVSAPGLRQDQLDRAADLSLNKYCSVRASLAPTVDVSFEAVVEE